MKSNNIQQNFNKISEDIINKPSLEESIKTFKNQTLLIHLSRKNPRKNLWGFIKEDFLIKKFVKKTIEKLNKKYGEDIVKNSIKENLK